MPFCDWSSLSLAAVAFVRSRRSFLVSSVEMHLQGEITRRTNLREPCVFLPVKPELGQLQVSFRTQPLSHS